MEMVDLKEKAREIRLKIVRMLALAGSGHSGGPLGSADFWASLYFGKVINFRANDPWWEERDRVVLSVGHYAPALYATLAEVGFFPMEELWTLRRLGSRLQGHPVARMLPGVETTGGPLAQGISQAVGMAIGAKIDRKKWRVICFMGDGEQDEGQVWEAYMLAVKEKLSNLVIVIDRNGIQIDGQTEKVMPLEPFLDKLRAFGLTAVEVDGHNQGMILESLKEGLMGGEGPMAIVLKTISGKGVSFMEGKYEWHGKVPTQEEAELAIGELNK